MLPPLWSARHRWVLIGVLGGALAWLVMVRTSRTARLSWPLEGDGPKAHLLDDRLDPNTASVSALSALPLIGPARASEIVTYRLQWLAEHPGRVAFSSVEDLQNVKGIGPTTIEHLRPWLKFDEP